MASESSPQSVQGRPRSDDLIPHPGDSHPGQSELIRIANSVNAFLMFSARDGDAWARRSLSMTTFFKPPSFALCRTLIKSGFVEIPLAKAITPESRDLTINWWFENLPYLRRRLDPHLLCIHECRQRYQRSDRCGK